MSAQRLQTPIAVVGVSALFPGSSDAKGFWSDILAGRDLITEVPATHWLVDDYYDPNPAAPDKTYCKRGAFLSPTNFDPMEFGVPPSIVPATDTAQILALIVAQKVLEDAAQGQFSKMDRERISVMLGVTSAQELLGSMVSRLQRPVWIKALRESGMPEGEAQAICDKMAASYVPWQESSFPGLLGNVVAGRIANRFDLRGTNAVTDAACASSMAAVSMGINELQLGQADLVITGGVDTLNDIFMFMCFSKTPALSPTGDCRPFSDMADGTILGEGMAMIALKRLADAERDGDRVYAVIRGVGTASDGRSKSVYAPVPEGQARALSRAYEVAGYGPETVELVEAHGTGTKAGDAAEFEGLRLAFNRNLDGSTNGSKRPWCALGSVKSQIGHTKAAAGAAGLFKAIMALHHKVIPPTIKVDRPNPKMEIESSPFYLSTSRRPWIRDASHPRRASVSSFGFGGSNFLIALEEFIPSANAKPAWRYRTADAELVLVSGATAAALGTACTALRERGNDASLSLATIARDAAIAFDRAHGFRLAIVASSNRELSEKLAQATTSFEKAPNESFSAPNGIHYAVGTASPGRIAFLYPGQGSQYVGMGADVAMQLDVAREAWDAAAVLSFDGEKLHDVVFPQPVFTDEARAVQAKTLVRTEWAQPALGVTSDALERVLKAVGVRPDVVAGHSFGEVKALHAAGAFRDLDLLRIARRRGELMRDAASIPGAMTAVPLPKGEVVALLAALKADVVIANHNGPTQVVLSGETSTIAAVEEALAKKGINAKRLPVATAFHSPLVAGSSGPLLEFLKEVDFQTPRLPVYANASAAPYPTDTSAVREQLAKQLGEPVRFVEQIEAMYEAGVRTFIEVGAGAVLSELTTRILAERPHRSINLDRAGKNGVVSLLDGLARLAVAGVAVDLSELFRWEAPASDRPAKKPAMSLPISGVNYGKPYPPVGGSKDLPAPNPPRVTHEVSPAFAAPSFSAPLAASAAPAPFAAMPLDERPTEYSEQSALTESDLIPFTRETEMAHDSEIEPKTELTHFTSDAHSAWVTAYQEAQRQTAEAHAAYQRAMADSHIAFLQMAESSFAGLSAMVTGVAPSATLREAPHRADAAPRAHSPAPLTRLPAAAPRTPQNARSAAPEMTAPAPVARPAVVAATAITAAANNEAPARVSAIATAVLAAPAPVNVDLEALLMGIVAEKTGYPTEMLNADMALEADLGIDSIKRVEILSAMRERAPGLAEVKPADLAALRTLGQIADHMRAHGALGTPNGATPEASNGATTAPTAAVTTATPAAESIDLEALMLTIVAEKTGYPANMLGADMELEADLGIDSIKRVEILSAMRERAPGLPEVKPQELAALRTLGQIVARMRAAGAPTATAETAPAHAPVPATGVTKANGKHSIARFATREVPSPAVGLSIAGLYTGVRIVITDDGTGLADAVASKLALRGIVATVSRGDVEGAEAVIFLGGMRPVASIDEAVAVNREAFHAARQVAAGFTANGGLFVAVQDTGGDFALRGLTGNRTPRAWLAGVAALARTAALEWPKASVKAIDCERGARSNDAVAESIVSELFEGGATLEVGLHESGERTTLASVLSPATPAESALLGPKSVVVASGGARGVTAASLVALAYARKPRIVLLGRTAPSEEPGYLRAAKDEKSVKNAIVQQAQASGKRIVPAEVNSETATVLANREVRATIAALEAAGSEVRYVSADVQNSSALAQALAGVRKEWGPIAAIVHGAGVLSDKLIAEKTDEQFARVWGTKVGGLRALLDATASDPLVSITLFSSVAARTGNLGQSDYAMANEVLNAVAATERARRGEACVIRSIGWGPWDGGMVTPSLKGHFEQMGVALIPEAVGASMFAVEAESKSVDTAIVVGGAAGDGPLGATQNRPLSLDVHVSRESFPEINDHRVAGMPVVPVALVVEWFLRAARAAAPNVVCTGLGDLRVLRGIKLAHFDDESGATERLTVHCDRTDIATGLLRLELRGRNNALHYTAVAKLAPHAAKGPRAAELPKLGAWAKTVIYDGHTLFHGDKFRVIREVQGVSSDGLVGLLDGAANHGWVAGEWQCDPALLDGGLQLAVLWGQKMLHGASLPMAIKEFRTYALGLAQRPVRGVVRATEVHAERAVCNVSFVSENGDVTAEILGLELVLRPGEHAAPSPSAPALSSAQSS